MTFPEDILKFDRLVMNKHHIIIPNNRYNLVINKHPIIIPNKGYNLVMNKHPIITQIRDKIYLNYKIV